MNNPTCAVLIIGNEILSGRTLDTNTQTIAKTLAQIGVVVKQTQTIPDIKSEIISSVLYLHKKYNYVITTGGIGPTHDDITSLAISEAFNVAYARNDYIYELLTKIYESRGEKMNKCREKMAFIPEGSRLIQNEISKVPGFAINNVYCLAGVPDIMKSMLDFVIKELKKGKIIKNLTHKVMIAESKIAGILGILQNKYPSVDMGSYPFIENQEHGTSLVLRSSDYDALEKAFSELGNNIKEFKLL